MNKKKTNKKDWREIVFVVFLFFFYFPNFSKIPSMYVCKCVGVTVWSGCHYQANNGVRCSAAAAKLASKSSHVEGECSQERARPPCCIAAGFSPEKQTNNIFIIFALCSVVVIVDVVSSKQQFRSSVNIFTRFSHQSVPSQPAPPPVYPCPCAPLMGLGQGSNKIKVKSSDMSTSTLIGLSGLTCSEGDF